MNRFVNKSMCVLYCVSCFDIIYISQAIFGHIKYPHDDLAISRVPKVVVGKSFKYWPTANSAPSNVFNAGPMGMWNSALTATFGRSFPAGPPRIKAAEEAPNETQKDDPHATATLATEKDPPFAWSLRARRTPAPHSGADPNEQ
jgi:hypothetical protein